MGGPPAWHSEIFFYERTRLGRKLADWEIDALAQLYVRQKSWMNSSVKETGPTPDSSD